MSRPRFRKFLIQVVISGSLIALQFAFPTLVQAQTTPWTGVCVGTTATSNGTTTDNTDVATLQGFQCLLANVLSISLTSLGITVFVMLVISSLRRQFSGGNAQGLEKSNQTALAAIASIVVFLSSFIILNLISNFTGIKSILKFTIPDSETCWPSGVRQSPCP